jgi:hypothetical protein
MSRTREPQYIPPEQWAPEIWAVIRHERSRGGHGFYVKVGAHARLLWQVPHQTHPEIALPCALPASTAWLRELYPHLMTDVSPGTPEEIAALSAPRAGAQLDLF